MNIQSIKKDNQTILMSYSIFILLFLITSCNAQSKKSESSKEETVSFDPIKNQKSILEIPFTDQNRTPLFTQKHSNLNGIVNEFVRNMFQDKNGTLWFGTNGDGIARYDGKFLEQFTINNGFGGTAVRSIAEDKSGNIWFGTSGGLTKYNGQSFTNFSKKQGILNNEIWSMTIDRNGIFWIGSLDGVSTFDGKEFRTFNVPRAPVERPNPIVSKNRITKILEDRNGNIWIATDGYGITILDPKTALRPEEKSFIYFTEKNGLPDNNVADLFEDKKGNIWIGTMYGGVSCYNGETFINYTESGVIEGIETYNFCEDKKGNIWFSAEGIGVYCYNGDSFSEFSEKDGLASNTVQTIFEDQKGQIWFGTWHGLSIFDGKSFFNAKDKEPWTE